MNSDTQTKQLLKIMIGAAWIDGTIQKEEREYLHKMAKKNNALSEDPEIKSLLSEIKPVPSQQCYQWLTEYLGEHPSQEDYQNLLESLSALIYSDGDVDTQEAELLTHLQMLDPATESQKSVFDKLLQGIRKIYRQAVT